MAVWQRAATLAVLLGTAKHSRANEDHAASVLKNLKRGPVDGALKVSTPHTCALHGRDVPALPALCATQAKTRNLVSPCALGRNRNCGDSPLSLLRCVL